MNILIIGSNFGFKVYYKAINSIISQKKIVLCSPNIHKKKIPKKIKVFKCFEQAIQGYKSFDLIICAARPDVQRKMVSFLYKKKKLPKTLLLEKPISNNIDETIKIIKKIDNKKTKIFSNFIFSKIENFKRLKKLIKNNKINEINYKWNFKQAYFVNKRRTWKTDPKLGGGLIYYYLIHVISNIRFFWNLGKNFSNIKVVKKKNLIYSIYMENIFKKTKIIIEINCNANKNFHQIVCLSKNLTYKLVNKSSDWTRNFYLYKNGKRISKKSDRNRIDLTTINLFEGLYHYKNMLKNNMIINNKIINSISKRVYK
jgi:hypothetical protein